MDQTTIRTKLIEVMATIFGVDGQLITENASMDTIETWDSLKHMKLIIALEQEFGIEFDDAEVVEMLSFRLIELAVGQKVAV